MSAREKLTLRGPGPAPEIFRLAIPGAGDTLRVGLLQDEPAGVIATRTASAAAFSATLEWPPPGTARGGDTPVLNLLSLLPAAGAGLQSSLREHAGGGVTTVSGELRAFEEEILWAAVEAALRAVAEAAAVREAVLRTRVLRAESARSLCPEAVGVLSRHLRESGVRVGFGPCWSPAPPEADVLVGCRGGRGALLEAMERSLEKRA